MHPKDEELPYSGPHNNHDHSRTDSDVTELEDGFDLDRLGRQRPAIFKNGLHEVLFCSSLLVSMFMAVSLFPSLVTY